MIFALVFFICLILGVPIFVTLGVPSLIELLSSPIPLSALAHSLYDGVDKFPLIVASRQTIMQSCNLSF